MDTKKLCGDFCGYYGYEKYRMSFPVLQCSCIDVGLGQTVEEKTINQIMEENMKQVCNRIESINISFNP